MSEVVRGRMVLGSTDPRHKHCDRCGRDVVRDRGRRDGLVLCGDCTKDKWLISRFRAQVR